MTRKASTAIAPGSGCQETNLGNFALNLDGSRSVSEIKVVAMRCSKILVSNDDSKFQEKSLD